MNIFLNASSCSYRTYEEWKHPEGVTLEVSLTCSYRTYEEWKLKLSDLFRNQHNQFLPYLWGMETNFWMFHNNLVFNSSYRTYEEWKQYTFQVVWCTILVLTVPMRNGNITSVPTVATPNMVLTVPMRNGNWGECDANWKIQREVLTVPMRNGNEVQFQLGYKGYLVLTVPMRNGNALVILFMLCSYIVLTVPMRNGNFSMLGITSPWYSSSYRTYEEWKRFVNEDNTIAKLSFLPYLWGMETHIPDINKSHNNTFLPYLWGMETGTVFLDFYRTHSFLPYLWGMETLSKKL